MESTDFAIKFINETVDFEEALDIKYVQTVGGEEDDIWARVGIRRNARSTIGSFPDRSRKPTIHATYFSNLNGASSRYIEEKFMGRSKLTEEAGKSLKHLTIKDLNVKIGNLQELQDEKALECIFSGKHLQDVLTNCLSLISLTLKNSYLIVPTALTSVLHHSLVELKLENQKLTLKFPHSLLLAYLRSRN